MDADSSPGPDGFPGSFYRFAWNIFGQDLIKAIQYCWRCKFIPKCMNSNFLFLLPKVQGAKKVEHFRPIWLDNFSFKILTRIITSRIGRVIGKLVSYQQGAFIKGRNIPEKIVLASEMVNELDVKKRGGNIGLKLDITQNYDSLSWDFLFKTLRHFGFSEAGINWFRILFESAKISVLVNGGPCGFFSVGRGLRQGDPLSPILFLIAEEVLSISISKQIHDGKIVPMVNRNGCQPSHMLFGDDIFVFCNGKRKSLDNLMKLLTNYQKASGQVINKVKSKCFVGGVSETRRRSIADFLQMELSEFPDKYLGVILNPGRVKNHQVWVKKLITVKYEKICAPITEGGFGLRRFEVINKALLMTLLWKIKTEDEEWIQFMNDKFKDKNGIWIKYHRKSSIWPGLKWVMNEVQEDSRWIVGNGKEISVWRDKWIKEDALKEMHPDNIFISRYEDMKVSDLILNGEWSIPVEIWFFFSKEEIPIIGEGEDKLIWNPDMTGKFSVKSAVHLIRKKYPKVTWGACATEENYRKKGFSTVSKCYLCGNGQDTMEHILWYCDFSEKIWHWLGGIFKFLNPCNFMDILKYVQKESIVVKEVWNIICYEEEVADVVSFKMRITPFTKESSVRMKGKFRGTMLWLFGRSCNGGYLGEVAGGIGVATNSIAEVMALIGAAEWAIRRQFFNVCFSLDSKAVLQDFGSDKVAKKGARLDRCEVIEYVEKPSFLGALEWENQTYFRFC
ncbi:uncharacterized protein LOC113360512 [Papaver somniferum]|uniref:uncharacterized protein LOC113360512 n=1 Tax=Papaver somniferum TaxID=3469 RepID=UPI000E6FF20C|nr:uncharacterized protein LOC113360512 [Papaver somniferum]